MVGAAPLRVIVGPDPLAAVTAADLRLAIGRLGLLLLGEHLVIETRLQNLHRLGLVLVLRLLVLAGDDQPGRHMGHADGRLGLVDMLPAGAGGPEQVDAQFTRVDLDLDIIRFRQDRNRAGRGMNPALRFGFRYPLHPVGAAFELEPRVNPVTTDHGDDLLETAAVGFGSRHQLDLPAVGVGVAAVHPEQVGGEQRRLLPAGTGADFQDDILVVVGIFR